MDINNEIDKVIKDYTNSLPPVHHTEEEDTIMLNTILIRAGDIYTKKREKDSAFNSIANFIKNTLRTNTRRYALAIGIVSIIIGIISFREYGSRTNNASTYTVVRKSDNNNTPLSKKDSFKNTDTMLLASIDFDSGNRGVENTIDRETIFGIIKTLLREKNITSHSNDVLITEKISSDTNSLVLMFKYNLSSHNITVLSIPYQSDVQGKVKVNVPNLIREIEYNVQTKVKMLNE